MDVKNTDKHIVDALFVFSSRAYIRSLGLVFIVFMVLGILMSSNVFQINASGLLETLFTLTDREFFIHIPPSVSKECEKLRNSLRTQRHHFITSIEASVTENKDDYVI